MFRSGMKSPLCMLSGIAMLAVSGCADFHLPRLDPSGEHLFICDSTPPPAATCPPGTVPTLPPAVVAPCPPPAQVPVLQVAPPVAVAISPPPQAPPRVSPYSDVATTLSPFRTVQPVGSQVVLVAGVQGGDGYLRTNRRLEWSLVPGSVGQFTAIGEGSFGDFFVGDFTPPRIVTAAFAVGSTTRVAQQAGGPRCPIRIVPGQGWIMVSSPMEGVSHATVVARDVVIPAERAKTATIYWIDAQYALPTPSITAAGTKQSLLTTVLRQSNRAPRPGWFVRYELACGPQALFGPSGTPSVEAVTNEAGQASVEIFQKDPSPGTSKIRVQIFKPADACSEKMLVRESSVLVTWTAPSLGIRQMGPPSAAIGGTITYRIEVTNPGDLTARELLASEEVPDGLEFVQSKPAAVVAGRRLEWRLSDLAPRQQQIIEATFRTTRQGTVAHCVNVTAAGGLRASHCASTNVLGALPGPATSPGPATTPGPATIQAPAIIPSPGSRAGSAAQPPKGGTTNAQAVLDIKVTPGSLAIVGSNVTFAVELTNRGTVPATRIVISDTYGEGLEYQIPRRERRLTRSVDDLAPGRSVSLGVMFRVTRPGPVCQHVEAVAAGGVHVATDLCVTAVMPAGTGPATTGPAPGSPVVTQPPPGGPSSVPPPSTPSTVPQLELRVWGPTASTVGKSAVFSAEIINRGQQPIANIVVSQRSDAALVVTQATEGAVPQGGNWNWSIPSLPPGVAIRRQVECECRQPGKGCCHFAVQASSSRPISGETCVDVAAATPPPGPAALPPKGGTTNAPNPVPPPAIPPGRLSVSVDNRNLVTAGKDQTFLVQVANLGEYPENDIVVTASIPLGTTISAATNGPPGVRYQVNQGIITFSSVGELPSRATLEYRITVTTTRAGPISLQVEAASRRLTHGAGTKTVDVQPSQ
jgi:uncharacterized repeat protein (TIGR01451 family)